MYYAVTAYTRSLLHSAHVHSKNPHGCRSNSTIHDHCRILRVVTTSGKHSHTSQKERKSARSESERADDSRTHVYTRSIMRWEPDIACMCPHNFCSKMRGGGSLCASPVLLSPNPL